MSEDRESRNPDVVCSSRGKKGEESELLGKKKIVFTSSSQANYMGRKSCNHHLQWGGGREDFNFRTVFGGSKGNLFCLLVFSPKIGSLFFQGTTVTCCQEGGKDLSAFADKRKAVARRHRKATRLEGGKHSIRPEKHTVRAAPAGLFRKRGTRNKGSCSGRLARTILEGVEKKIFLNTGKKALLSPEEGPADDRIMEKGGAKPAISGGPSRTRRKGHA